MSKTYDSVGRCIYCGKTAAEAGIAKLQDEHIIALSLAGGLILPEASCSTCADQTGADEGFCAGVIFNTHRTLFGWKSRKRKRPTKLTAGSDNNGKTAWREVPVAEYPPVIGLPQFNPPGRLSGMQTRDGDMTITGVYTYFAEGWEHKIKSLGEKGAVFTKFKTDPFCRMLAKIAHFYSIAELSLGSFKPYLNDIILDKAYNWAEFIGSPAIPIKSEDVGLHDMQIRKEMGVINVYIRLYGQGFFNYLVVVGEP